MGVFSSKRRTANGGEINLDEILLDAKNLPEFNVHQMEGRIERPISKWAVRSLGIVFFFVAAIFSSRAAVLQIVHGDTYRAKADANHLDSVPIFSQRGIIYDRTGTELAWNTAPELANHLWFGSMLTAGTAGATDEHATTSETYLSEPYLRSYIRKAGFGHLLGYVSYPLKDSKGLYYQNEFQGKAGIEGLFDKELNGANGTRLTETDALGNIAGESVIEPPKDGSSIILSIDAGVQSTLSDAIASLADNSGFVGGGGVIMDVRTGEILALTSYPEYDSQVLSLGDDVNKIRGYMTGVNKPLLNRVLSGLYTPGSIVKPFIALGALEEGVIDPNKKILSTGSISIPNPYDAAQSTVFRDWRAHGWVDMRQALAVSSDVYFYEVGGGYKNEQKGLGIANIKKYSELFGLGTTTGIILGNEATGVIPDPQWKAANFNGEPWRLGDTYHTAVGQYGFQVTPIQVVRAVAALANNGTLLVPQILKGAPPEITSTISLHQENFQIVKEGMREGVVSGTAAALVFPDVAVAAKTGTAELGVAKQYVNSWTTGFFPYENPQYAFAVVMERGPVANTVGASFIMRQVIDWMRTNRPEYVGLPGKTSGQ